MTQAETYHLQASVEARLVDVLATLWADSVPLRGATDLRLFELILELMREEKAERDRAKRHRWASRTVLVRAELGRRGYKQRPTA